MNFQKFCNDDFFDSNLTWNSETPRLTRCLAQVGLQIVPSVLFFLLFLLELKFTLNSKHRKIRLNGFNVTRYLICFFCIMSNLSLLYNYSYEISYTQNSPYTLSDLIASVCKVLVFIFLTVVYYYHRINGVISSGINFFVTFLSATCSFILLLDTLLYNKPAYSDFEISNINRLFLCNLCLFVLSCFTDDAIDAGLKPSENGESLLDNFETNEIENEKVKISPKQYSSFISRISFYWYFNLVNLASKRELKINEIYEVEDDMQIDLVIKKFDRAFNKELEHIEKLNQNLSKKIKFSLKNTLKVIWRAQGFNILFLVVLKTMADLSIFLQPLLLNFMINFVNNPNEQKWHGVLILIGFVFSIMLKTLFSQHQNMRSFAIAINLKTSFSNLIFNKTLKLSPKARRNRTTGEIINLFSIDVSRFSDFAPYFTYIVSAPLQIGIGFIMLYYLLDKAAIVGFVVIMFVMMAQYYLNKLHGKILEKELKTNDERIKLINEVLSGIKILKFYGWEKRFEQKIGDERKKQVNFNRIIYYIEMVLNWLFFSFSPFLMLTTTFAIYIFLIEGEFTADRAFSVILIFNILDYPIECLPTLMAYLVSCKVSLKRVSSFLAEDELESYVSRNYDDKIAISIKDKAKFVWDIKSSEDEIESNRSEELKKNKLPFELKDVELEVEKGSFFAVIGQVGSGKSSLISAILGEMHLIENDLGIKGKMNISDDQTICFVAQQAWIQNNSFKENILFGKLLNNEKYKDVIAACALEPDLLQFEAGDETEIGEKGINLSGGQKQRVSLARACYSSILIGDNKQIILLDDPLSAVDAHVGKHLCENVLSSRTGILKDTTRILVTNQINQLSDLNVDQIVLLKDGKIGLKCTYDELLEMEKNGELDDYNLRLTQNEQSEEASEDEEKISEKSDSNSQASSEEKIFNGEKKNLDKKMLIEKEKIGKGKVEYNNHLIYLKYFGYLNAVFVLIFIITENVFQVVSRINLANWTKIKLNSTGDIYYRSFHRDHLLTFAGLASLECVFDILMNTFMTWGMISTMTLFHEKLLYSILRSPMSFFDTTPLGRIVNRFSKDIESIDNELALAIRELVVFLLRLIFSILILTYKQPNNLVFYFIIFAIYYYMMNLYISSSRQLKRYDATTRSPIFSHVSETLNGMSTIRAYDKTNEFKEYLKSKMNVNNRAYFYFLYGNRWLNFYLDILSTGVILIIVTQFILQKDSISAADAGLLLSYALNLTPNLTFVVRFMGRFETNAISIERVNEYCNNEAEDEWVKEVRPDADWPKKGEIEFIDYSTQYRKDTKLILKDLNFKVNNSEKVGIVGRTGAGKSTITLSLFRIIEPVNGRILIDNLDISQIGLHDLRSKLSIIPQDAVLFTGSIRFNLDPFDKHSDDEIYESLEHAHLIDFVNTLEDGIQHKIAEGGENLSVGQRQLICLARALLRKSKILVLDEATASIDFATDELVQNTIRTEFKDCTTITIAHRLKTVLDSDKILVLDKGELREYDEPDRLLKNTNSLFYSLALKANVI